MPNRRSAWSKPVALFASLAVLAVMALPASTAALAQEAPGGDPDPRAASISLVKAADVASYEAPGVVITYSITATNNGTSTLSGVTIGDPLKDLSQLACDVPQPAVLAPGTKNTCRAAYVVTQADVDAGAITNSATVSADGGAVTGEASLTVPAVQSQG